MKNGNLTANQFAVLNQVRINPSATQRALAEATGLSLGTVNNVLNEAGGATSMLMDCLPKLV